MCIKGLSLGIFKNRIDSNDVSGRTVNICKKEEDYCSYRLEAENKRAKRVAAACHVLCINLSAWADSKLDSGMAFFNCLFKNAFNKKEVFRRLYSGQFRSLATEVETILPNSRIRNIGISAHIDSGKTTLTERILFYTRKISEIHEVKGKVGATMDFMQLERERGITIQSASTYTTWRGYNINLIDTPGHVDFTIEVERALRVLDGAILVLCGVGRVQTQTYTVHRQMNRYKVPFIAFVNKLDRMNADPISTLKEMREKLKINPCLIQLPIGLESNFKGIIDIINERAIYFEGSNGLTCRKDEIPSEFSSQVKDYRQMLIETLSNFDEVVGERYINEETPTVEEINNAIRKGVISRTFTPVFIGSALKNKGVQPLLDGVINYLPDPSEIQNFALKPESGEKINLNPERSNNHPAVALAFKLESGSFGQLTYVRMYQGQIVKNDFLINTRTQKKIRAPRLVLVHAKDLKEATCLMAGDIGAFFGVDCNSGDTFISEKCEPLSMESMFVPEPVMSLAIEAKNSEDVMKLAKAFSRFQKEDPTFKVNTDSETREIIISGMGELHLEIYTQRLNLEYNVKVNVGKPKVSYRETLREIERFDYLHKRQTGGRGQFAHIIGRIEPLPHEKYDFIEFVNETTGTAIPRGYIPSIQKGFFEACERGYLSGHRVSGIRFVIETGSTHEVDSSDYAFRVATMGAIKQVFERQSGYIIEPIMKVSVVIPAEYRSPITKVIHERSGLVKDFEQNVDICTIDAEVPLNLMFGFTNSLRQTTQGKGEYSMEFSHYNEAPDTIQNELREAFQVNETNSKK